MDPIPAADAGRPSGHIWRFADCELDERRRELRVRGAAVDIEAKPFEVLRQLLAHAGEVVTKTELLESVWPGTTVVDGSLATAISKVRKLLDDDDRVIVTVPRVGYKLAVTVQCRFLPGAPVAELALQPGQPVPGRDQWRLTRRLDVSPSNDVWLAEHPKTRETRVFKFATDDVRLKSLKREVTVGRLLRESLGDRAEFVRLLEWNFDRPPYFVESEYSGLNLAEWADAQGGLRKVPVDLRLKLLVDVAKAVASAHALDLLHKDLKPANILVASTSDGTPQIKIADFGSASLLVPARLTALGITNLGFTQTAGKEAGALTGTLMYLAPEVLAGQSPTAVSDVYALGVLLYQLVAADFRKPLAPGWEADIPDPLIREDIAEAASGDPARRLQTTAEFVERLVNLDRRRAEREALERQREAEAAAEMQRNRMRARRPWLAAAGLILLAGIVSAVTLFRPEALSVRTVAVRAAAERTGGFRARFPAASARRRDRHRVDAQPWRAGTAAGRLREVRERLRGSRCGRAGTAGRDRCQRPVFEAGRSAARNARSDRPHEGSDDLAGLVRRAGGKPDRCSSANCAEGSRRACPRSRII